ncbi:MAG: processing protein [Actinomycetota bacterium]|nr:processing protein [Actinomycetota bacterium]
MGGVIPAAERAARAALTRLAEPGDAWLGRAVAGLGAAEVLDRVRSARAGEDERLGHYRVRLPALAADRELATRAGARVVVPGDDEWPAALDDLGERAPIALWVAGEGQLADAARRSVSVVGARACTAYGEHVAGELAAGLGDRGWTVVSGGAYGIDAAAHRGALAVDAPTVAVLACGVDVPYPAAHDGLLRAIRARGVVVSELPPGSRPTRRRFLDRNRVIAALGRGTVVVEAATRSGAKNTAGQADDLSRPVMAVPGPVTSAASVGCHELIRGRGAALVTDAADVLDLVGDLVTDARDLRRGEARPHDSLDPVTLRVLEALPVRRRASADSVGRVAGLDAPTVLRALGLLAATGLADAHEGRWRRTPTATRAPEPPMPG